jgi:hypothetical protein
LVTPKAAPTEIARFSNLSHERLQIAQGFVSAQITLGGVELLHRIRQGQFALRKLGVANKTAPEIWNAVHAA